jgi:ubiquinone/menaquinone biosynthesis C-methylase UbiE
MKEIEQRELAFLHDLYVEQEWTQRFANLFDKYVIFSDEDEKILYVNAGTGNHVLELREKLSEKTKLFAICDNQHTLSIAQSKAAVLKSNVIFSTQKFNDEKFDVVIANASFVESENLPDFVKDIAKFSKEGGKVIFFTVTSGSFGEVFSFLWEVLFNEGLGTSGDEAAKLIESFPTVSHVEQISKEAGLVRIKTYTSNEIFEYRNGAELINSVLVSRFFLPNWLRFLDEQQKNGVCELLSRLIDEEYGDMSFRFSVKATLIKGEKPL